MKKSKFNGMLLLVIIILITTFYLPGQSVAAATNGKIKLGDFIKLTVQALDLEVTTSGSDSYINAALEAGIVNSGEFADYTVFTTRTDAAVILNRADEYLHGDTVDPELLKLVLSDRITDIKKIASDKREAVAKIYAKGFIKGYSNGHYIKSREYRGSQYMTAAGAKNVISMLKDTKKRAKLSPDGQLIRTTNLPKNAKSYEYILETYPNAFYEKKFRYQLAKYYYKPVELVDYASPTRMKDVDAGNVNLNKYKDVWMERVETSLQYRFNVDYRTIGDKWVGGLRSCYTQYGDAKSDKRITDDILAYVKVVKKNKIVIQSQIIAVEPSTLYVMGSYYVRVYIKFKVDYSGTKLTADDLIGGDTVYMPTLKKNTWHTGVYDIRLGSVVYSDKDMGQYIYVTDDSLYDPNPKGDIVLVHEPDGYYID